MSGLTYTGVGLLFLTAAGLTVKVTQKVRVRKLVRQPLNSVRSPQRPTELAHDPVSVAIVVPAHNESATVQQTIYSCVHQTYPIAQVIVVADNCTDATAELARAAGATVIEGSGGSKAAAQNLALPYVATDLVVALDADNILDPTAVAHMVATIRAGHAGTCASVLPKDTNTIYSKYRTIYHTLANGWTKRVQDVLGRQLVLSGMANCHRVDVLTMLGGFPNDSVTEDFNLTWALHRHGYPLAFTPEAIVYTQEPTSFRELIGQMHRWTAGFAQCMVTHRAPLLDPAAFIVVVSLAGDAFLGGLATLTFFPFVVDRGISACWRWWGWLWILVTTASIGVAINQLGVRNTAHCLPGWLILQALTGPITTWWLVQEWVLGRHLTTWTGRHGCRPIMTHMSTRRKKVLTTGAALAGIITFTVRRVNTRYTDPRQ